MASKLEEEILYFTGSLQCYGSVCEVTKQTLMTWAREVKQLESRLNMLEGAYRTTVKMLDETRVLLRKAEECARSS